MPSSPILAFWMVRSLRVLSLSNFICGESELDSAKFVDPRLLGGSELRSSKFVEPSR